MRNRLAFSLLGALLACACTNGSSTTDRAVSDTVSDTALLSDAQGAANEVIRNAADCEAVSASFNAAMSELDRVEAQLQTEAGRTTIGTLRKQVITIGEACGLR